MIIDAINGGGGGGGGTVIVPKPTVTIGTYTYDGTEQGATIEFTPSTASKYCVITNATATNAGTYTLTIALKNTAKMVWGDMTTADLTYSYTIGKAPLTIPTLSTDSFTYDGSEKSLTFSGFDGDLMIKSGDLSGTNVGNYSATISLIDGDNYKWSDNTSNPRVYNWTIHKIILTVPTVSDTTKTYSGSAQSPTITGFDSTTMTKTGDSATNVGSYTVSFDLIDSDNYQWNSSTTSFAWTINKATVTLPAVTNTSKTYNGSAQSPTIASYDTTKLTVSGNSATNAGNYTVVFSLVDSDNYQMSGTNNVAWSIARATSAITLSASSVTLDSDHLTRSVTVSNVKGRTLSVSSSNTSVATASISGSTVTISNVNQTNGNATITISAAQSTNYNASSKTVSVSAEFFRIVTFADGTDTQIKAMLDAYYADEITWQDMGWAVGDTRKIHFNSMQAPSPNSSNTWAAQDITVVIVAHDHTDLATPINGHTKACITVETRECMNPGEIYVNGDSSVDTTFTKWSNLYMRTYLNSVVWGALASGAFKNAIKPSKHYRHTAHNTSASEEVTDTLFLPSYPEILGTVSNSEYVATRPVEGTQFPYYATSSNRVKYGNNNGASNGVVQEWWQGSAGSYTSSGYYWCRTKSNGGVTSTIGSTALPLSPAFAM